MGQGSQVHAHSGIGQGKKRHDDKGHPRMQRSLQTIQRGDRFLRGGTQQQHRLFVMLRFVLFLAVLSQTALRPGKHFQQTPLCEPRPRRREQSQRNPGHRGVNPGHQDREPDPHADQDIDRHGTHAQPAANQGDAKTTPRPADHRQ